MYKMHRPINLINKKKLGRQLLPSPGQNGVVGRTSVSCPRDIGDSSLFSVCVWDCTKQASYVINLIYLYSNNVSNIIFPLTERSHLRLFKINFPRTKPEKLTYREGDVLRALAEIQNARFCTDISFWKKTFMHPFCILNQNSCLHTDFAL